MGCLHCQTRWRSSVSIEMASSPVFDVCSSKHCCTGIVPSVILTVFLGIFALWTAKLLIDFKHNHPEVHNMGI